MLGLLADSVSKALADGFAGLWATGDMTWEFGNEKNFEKLMQYEWGLEQMFRVQPALNGICQYHRDTLPENAASVALSRHRTVYINETLSRMNPFYSETETTTASHWSVQSVSEMLNRMQLSAEAIPR